jgi:MFS family permease
VVKTLKMNRLFLSLNERHFRLYYLAQLASQHGAWMHRLVQAWIVYRLTQSGFMLGLVAFMGTIPMLVLGLWGGAMADRLSRRRLLLITQLLAMTQGLVLAALTLSGWIQVWHILILALSLGVVQAFEVPARQAIVPQLVRRQNLPNAIALNSIALHVARMLGPAVAGWLVGMVGEGWVFVMNAISFLPLLWVVWSMRAEEARQRPVTSPALNEGLRYIWQQRLIRAVLSLVALSSICSTSYVVLMPVFAREVFGGHAGTLGLLLGAAGLGALGGALHLAHRGRGAGLEVFMGWAGVSAGFGLVTFALTQEMWMALLILPLIGFSVATLVTSGNTVVQLQVPDALRGRVMGVFTVVFIGHTPLGNLAAGIVSQHMGSMLTVLIFGVLWALGAMVFMRVVAKART